MDAFLKALREFGVGRIAVIVSVALTLVVGALFALFRSSPLALLYGNVELSEGARIVKQLEEMGVPFTIKGDGGHIYVPQDQVLRLRMALAEAGLPNGDSGVGYEVFDRSDVLGTTTFIQDVNLLRALEGELARTIRSLQPVAGVRVHIVMPKRELFSKEKAKPTASILLKMKNGLRLGETQVRGIQLLVAAAVPGLACDQISILDDRGTVLARGDTDEERNKAFSRAEEARVAYETRLARMIEALLGRSVGLDRVRAEVSVVLDTDRLTEHQESYDGDNPVVRSTQNSSDIENSQEKALPTTAQNNLPDAASPYGAQGGQQRNGRKTEETINYEISKKITTRVKEWGGLRTLSVAVMVDGTYIEDEKGAVVYKARTPEEMAALKKLVQTAVGFRADRGDAIEVVNMRFVSESETPFAPPPSLWGFERAALLQVFQNTVIALIVFGIFFFVLRPLLNRLLDRQALSPVPQPAGVATTPASVPVFSPSLESIAPSVAPGEPTSSGGEERQTDSAQEEPVVAKDTIIGGMRASLLARVESLIEKYPDDAAAVLRTWMKNS